MVLAMKFLRMVFDGLGNHYNRYRHFCDFIDEWYYVFCHMVPFTEKSTKWIHQINNIIIFIDTRYFFII